jgi:hypothetical protein
MKRLINDDQHPGKLVTQTPKPPGQVEPEEEKFKKGRVDIRSEKDLEQNWQSSQFETASIERKIKISLTELQSSVWRELVNGQSRVDDSIVRRSQTT